MKGYQILIALLIVSAAVFSAGCGESDAQVTEEAPIKEAAAPIEEITEEEATEEEATTTGKAVPQQTPVSEFQDDEWLTSARQNMIIVGADLNTVGNAAEKGWINSLGTYSKILFEDTQLAIDESDLYTVSPELQYAKDEYRLTMVACNWAGLCYCSAVDEMNAGNVDQATEYLNTGTEFLTSGQGHLDNFTEEIESMS